MEFDTVLAMHVLEHDDNPADLLKTIMRYVKRGGNLVIEVPNVDCVWSNVFGKFWDGWYVPYHRQHFTKRSLIHLMESQGLVIRSVYRITVPTMGRSFANIFGKTNNLFWLILGAAFHPLQWLGEVVTGQPTAIRVVATRN